MTAPVPAWERAIAHDGHVVLEASAGTGKTYALEHLVVSLVEKGTPLERILVVTFTEKAARELRERVRKRLTRRLLEVEAEAAASGTSSVPDGPDAPAARVKQALFGFDQATIATIHGFCQRVLTRYAFEGGRLLEQSLVDGRTVFREVLLEVLRELLAGDGPVTEWLRSALEARGLDGLVEDLHAAHTQRGRIEPGSADLAPVEDACARVDPEAVREALQAAGVKMRGIGNFLAACAEGFAEAAKDQDPFTALATYAKAEKKTYTRSKEPVTVPELVPREVAPHCDAYPALVPLVDAFEALGAHRTTREALLAHALLPEVRTRLKRLKAERGLFDFDDLLRLVRDALEAPGQGERLRDALRDDYEVALIDEFQDTDAVQWAIFERLFFDRDQGHKLVVVGDPKQAIYGFRGADVHTYLGAVDKLAESGGRVLRLDTCYRATADLVDGYNRLFEDGFFPPAGGIDYHPVACGRPTLRLEGVDGVPAAAVSVVRLRPAGEGKLSRGAVRSGWAEFVAQEIRRLVDPTVGLRLTDRDPDAPPALPDDTAVLGHGDVHVLTRTAKEAQELGQVLRRHRIPHAFYRQAGLFQTPEAADVAALLSALAHLDRPSERLRAWLTPFFGLEVADLVRARDLDHAHPLVRRLGAWRGLAEDQDWAGLFDAVVHESGLIRRLLFSQPGERELTNYLHLFEVLLIEAHAAPVSLEELSGRVEAWVAGRRQPEVGDEPDVQRLDTEKDAVQILTMHAAKGLEAPVVFLAGGWGAPPASLVKVFHRGGERVVWIGDTWGEATDAVEAERAAEDRRLLYVALTRAKGRLYLPHVDDGFLGRRLDGAYAVVRDRLDTVLAAGPPAGSALEVRDHVCGEEAVEPAADAEPGPPVDLEVPSAEGPAADLAAGRRRAAPVLVTSYSRIKSGFERHRVAEGAEADGLRDDAEDRALPEPEGPALPGGKVVGVFLHQALEETDYAEVRASEGYLDWAARPEVARRFRSLALRHGIAAEHLPQAQALVHRALTTPVAAPGPELPEGFCQLAQAVPEMPFVYPIPERAHRLLGTGTAPGVGAGVSGGAESTGAWDRAPDGGLPWRVERGFLQGVVDLVFEHDGRFWLLDWKSDRLPDYRPGPLAAHVEAAYRDQARIYAIAVLRALGIHTEADHRERFGGILYCFLRGFDARGAGLWVQRPGWEEIVSWERWLLERGAHEWGVPVDRVLGS